MPDAVAEHRRFTFPARARVRRQREFQRAFRTGARVADDNLTLWSTPNGLDWPRLGLIVGRKHGHAVRRNRLKRILREAFRLAQHQLPPGRDFLATPRLRADIQVAGCVESLVRLAARLEQQLARRAAATD